MYVEEPPSKAGRQGQEKGDSGPPLRSTLTSPPAKKMAMGGKATRSAQLVYVHSLSRVQACRYRSFSMLIWIFVWSRLTFWASGVGTQAVGA